MSARTALSLSHVGFAAFATMAILGIAPSARAQESTAARCVAEAERAQKTRDDGHLTESRAMFVRCGAEECPGVVRRECVKWLGEVDDRIPTLVVSTRSSEGKDVLGAEIVLDGTPVPPARVGREIQVDPGPHTLRATLAGYDVATDSVVVREREKGRPVVLVLRAKGESVATPPPPKARSVPLLSWILGGVAVAGGAGFGIFWSQALGEKSDLQGSCSPYCSDAQMDDVRTPRNLAYVSLGVGIGAAIGAVAVYFLQSPSAPTSPQKPRTGGAPSSAGRPSSSQAGPWFGPGFVTF